MATTTKRPKRPERQQKLPFDPNYCDSREQTRLARAQAVLDRLKLPQAKLDRGNVFDFAEATAIAEARASEGQARTDATRPTGTIARAASRRSTAAIPAGPAGGGPFDGSPRGVLRTPSSNIYGPMTKKVSK